MMQLIFTTDAGLEASILFDATLSEDHVAEAFIPEHPVEEGVNVTDHIRPALDRLSARVHVTNTPIRPPKNQEKEAPDYTVEGLSGILFNFANQELMRVTHNRIVRRAIAAPGPSLSLRIGFDEVSVRAGLGAFVVPAVVEPATQVFATITRKPLHRFERVRTIYTALVAHRAKGTVFRVITSLKEYDNMVIERVGAPRSVEDGDAITISLDMREVRFAAVEIGDALRPQPVPVRAQAQRNRGNQSAEESDDERNRSWLRSGSDALGGDPEAAGGWVRGLLG